MLIYYYYYFSYLFINLLIDIFVLSIFYSLNNSIYLIYYLTIYK